MARVSFEQLYGENKTAALSIFLVWANDFLDGLGNPSKSLIDLDEAFSFVSNLRHEGFPAKNGYDAASPFKKAAHLYTYLHAINPFKSPLPKECVGEYLAKFPFNTASLVGFSLVKACLTGVTIHKVDGDAVLSNPIQVSQHFMFDLVEASGGISPANHFKQYSLLFEALAYEANPGVCYAKTF